MPPPEQRPSSSPLPPQQLSPNEVMQQILSADLPPDRKRAALLRASEMGLIPALKDSRETPAGQPGQDVILQQPAESLLSKMFPAEGIKQVLGAHTSTAGALAGQVLASVLPGAAITRPLLGAAGGALGQYGAQLFGQPKPTIPQLALGAGLDLALGGAEEATRSGLRGVISRLPGAVALRRNVAGETLSGLGQRTFNPPSTAEVRNRFAAVDTLGITADLTPVQSIFGNITGAPRGALLKEISALHGGVGKVLTQVAQGKTGAPLSLAELQRARSLLHQQAGNLEFSNRPGAPTLAGHLRETASALDDVIDAALIAHPLGQTPEGQTLIRHAREGHQLQRSAAELDSLVFDSASYKDEILQLDPNKLFNKLRQVYRPDKENIPRRYRQLRSALDSHPGASESIVDETEALARQFKKIQFTHQGNEPFTLKFPLVRGFLQRVSQIIVSPTGRRLFERAIIEGRGKFSVNYLPLIEQAVEGEIERRGGVTPTTAVGAGIDATLGALGNQNTPQ